MYCLAGWEGSAHDARVLRDALARPNGLKVPKGSNLTYSPQSQYYLCDAGYANCEGFLAPFRGQRYHLKEWGQNRPNTPEEYFNMKHSSARNVIERAFGLLKMRWAILRDTTWLSLEVVRRIVHACCLLHNFIKQEAGVDALERAYVQHASTGSSAMAEEMEEVSSSMQPSPEWTNFRNQKAQEMWQSRPRR
ncbi:Protein ALP1-like [Linum perenne]